MGLLHTSVCGPKEQTPNRPIADPKQTQTFKTQTPNRNKADLGSAFGVCFGVMLCLISTVSKNNKRYLKTGLRREINPQLANFSCTQIKVVYSIYLYGHTWIINTVIVQINKHTIGNVKYQPVLNTICLSWNHELTKFCV